MTRPATYRDVFAEPVFRLLFLSRSLAIAADTLRMLALSVLVFASTGSAFLTAITFGIGFVPQVIGGALLGALADRLPPRPLIVSGYLLEAVVAAAIALGRPPVGVSLALVAAVAVVTPVFNGASTRLVAEALRGDSYVLGRSLSTVSSGAAQLVGLAAGGAAVAALGPVRALLVTAGCHLVAALWVRLRLPAFGVLAAKATSTARAGAGAGTPGELASRPGGTVGELASRPGATAAVRQSLTVTGRLLRDRDVRALMLVQWLPPGFVVAAEALIVPLVAARGFATGSAGLLLASVPLGMLVGSLVMGRLVRPAVRERLVAPVLVALGVDVSLLAVPLPLPVMVGLLFVVGAGFSYSLGVQRPFLDAVDPNLRGQAFAVLTTGLMTLQGLGPVVIGLIAQGVSIGAAMAVAGAGPVLIGLTWWYTRGRHGPCVPASAVGLG